MSARSLRIVSYNVRYFGHFLRGLASTARSKEGIAEGLAALEPTPDIICLQEVETISIRSRVAFWGPSADETQLESFMDILESAFRAAGKAFAFEAFYFRAHAYRVRATTLYTTGLAVLVNTATIRIRGHNVEAATSHHPSQRDAVEGEAEPDLRTYAPNGCSGQALSHL